MEQQVRKSRGVCRAAVMAAGCAAVLILVPWGAFANGACESTGQAVSAGLGKDCTMSEAITGELRFVANPCTTEPCLPGMTFALLSAGETYYLTRAGAWVGETPEWEGYALTPGDRVTVTGDTTEKRDSHGAVFLELDAEAIRPE